MNSTEWINVHAQQENFQMKVHDRPDLFSDIVRRKKSYSTFDLCLLDYFLSEGSSFIDIGAHIGWYTMYAAQKVGSQGKVFSFEPAPDNRNLLLQNTLQNNFSQVFIDESALSDRTGTALLKLSNGNSGDHGLATSNQHRRGFSAQEISIHITTLDEKISAEEFKKVSLIKMDAQGSEPKILAGMRKLLSQHRPPLLMEYSPTHIYECGSSPFEIFSFLEINHYVPFQVNDEVGPQLSQILSPVSIQDLFFKTQSLVQGDWGIDLFLLPQERLSEI